MNAITRIEGARTMSEQRSYEEGVQDGRIKSLELRVDALDLIGLSRERRLQYLERISYGLLGIVTFTTVLPGVFDTLSRLTP